MKICVLVKQVPDKDSDIKVENNENKIEDKSKYIDSCIETLNNLKKSL